MKYMADVAFCKRLALPVLAAVLMLCSPLHVIAATEDARVEIINAAELEPAAPQSAELDAYLDELLSAILDEDMDTYEQVKACYDYLVDNVRYGSHMRYLNTPIGGATCGDIYYNYGEVEGFGAVALTAGRGMCNAYSAAFILMTRKLGLDAYLVEGSTRGSGGGYSYHKWCEINIDGTAYVFDPQLEQDLSASGLSAYTVFCRTYDQIPGRYSK